MERRFSSLTLKPIREASLLTLSLSMNRTVPFQDEPFDFSEAQNKTQTLKSKKKLSEAKLTNNKGKEEHNK